MQAKVTKHDHYWVLAYEGDSAGLMPGPLPEVIVALQSGAREIILDMSGMVYLGQVGVKALKETLYIARQHEANIGIAAPPPKIRRALKLGGLTPDIPIYYTANEAIAKLDMIDYQETARTDLMDRLVIIQKELPVAGHLRKALKQHSTKPQYRMIPVRDTKKAYEVLVAEKVDCILIDASFPLYQVTQFIEQVETDDRLPSIPILVVSSNDRLDQADLMIRNGAYDLVRFPFVPIEVVARLQTVISYLKDHKPYYPPEKVAQPRTWKS